MSTTSATAIDLQALLRALDRVAADPVDDDGEDPAAALPEAVRAALVALAASETLRQRNELLEEQRATILRLSVPVVEIWEGVLGVPLIGHLDGERTRQLMDALLAGVVRKQARSVILDMTGIDAVDHTTAANLLKLARAIKLLGSRVILCGIRSDVARTFITLEAELGAFEIHASLRDGIAACIAESRARAARARAPKSP